MYINHADRLERESIGAHAESPTAFNETTDMFFFNAQLNLTAEPHKRLGSSARDNLFNMSISESSAGRIKKGLRDRLQNKPTKEAHALPESLARANLEVVAPVKLLGMMVKGIDKISNMG